MRLFAITTLAIIAAGTPRACRAEPSGPALDSLEALAQSGDGAAAFDGDRREAAAAWPVATGSGPDLAAFKPSSQEPPQGGANVPPPEPTVGATLGAWSHYAGLAAAGGAVIGGALAGAGVVCGGDILSGALLLGGIFGALALVAVGIAVLSGTDITPGAR